ncbi:MAG: hypothetical protein ABIO04_03560 [Ferruginibacter sp.]
MTELGILYQGLSGKMGDKVFYQRNGKTFVRRAPGSYNKNATPKQAESRTLFTQSHQFAQSVIDDPILKALYTKKANGKCSAYIAAMKEFLSR